MINETIGKRNAITQAFFLFVRRIAANNANLIGSSWYKAIPVRCENEGSRNIIATATISNNTDGSNDLTLIDAVLMVQNAKLFGLEKKFKMTIEQVKLNVLLDYLSICI